MEVLGQLQSSLQFISKLGLHDMKQTKCLMWCEFNCINNQSLTKSVFCVKATFTYNLDITEPLMEVTTLIVSYSCQWMCKKMPHQ